jgi:hypothetical protein
VRQRRFFVALAESVIGFEPDGVDDGDRQGEAQAEDP